MNRLTRALRQPSALIPLTAVFLLVTAGLAQIQFDLFGQRTDRGLVDSGEITEASGLAASIINPGILWTHNDSGDRNRVFALDETNGSLVAEYILEGCEERDWEDIAVGPGPVDHVAYLYVGNIGDNKARYDRKYIYRVKEPVVPQDTPGVHYDTLRGADVLTFTQPDGNRDTETLMVDPLTRDLFVISKRENPCRVYRFPFPQNPDTLLVPQQVATIACTLAVGGDISHLGDEVLVKTYDLVFYWKRLPGQSIGDLLSTPPAMLPYFPPEPQGEGIAWKMDGSGYFTLSEERHDIPARLYFYPRLEAEDKD